MKTAGEIIKAFVDAGSIELYEHLRVLNPETKLESPLECDLERVLTKHIPIGGRVIRQYQVPTYRGTFRIDLVVVLGERKIGFECDGRQYHDWSRDIFRDAVILSESNIEAIYRIEGADVFYRLETALMFIGCYCKGLFSERGMKNLWALSEFRLETQTEYQDEEGISVHYDILEDGERRARFIRIRSLSRDHHDFKLIVSVCKEYRNVKTEGLSSLLYREIMARNNPKLAYELTHDIQ